MVVCQVSSVVKSQWSVFRLFGKICLEKKMGRTFKLRLAFSRTIFRYIGFLNSENELCRRSLKISLQ